MHYFSGIYRFRGNRAVCNSEIKSMLLKPDADGAEWSVFAENNFGLCVERPSRFKPILSIPLFSQSETKDISVVFEGRIYNGQELAGGLIKREAIKRDSLNYSELINALYQASGLSFLPLLRGSYCFVIWDKKKNELILNRDAVGAKPLYYNIHGNDLVFGTFLKSIFKNKLVKKEIGFEQLCSYFFIDNLNRGEDTEYEGIKNLMPGYVLVANKSGVKMSKIELRNEINFVDFSKKEIVNCFYNVLKDSAKRHLFLDRSANIAFSGGLDSGVLAAFARKFKIPINTFTIEFESLVGNKMLDYKLAREKARKIKANHHRLKLSPANFLEKIRPLISGSGRLINFNNLNSFYIFDWISKYSDSVISGDGSEEQMSLYQHHLVPYFSDSLLSRLPDFNAKRMLSLVEESYYNLFFARSWEPPRFGEGIEAEFKKQLFSSTAQKKVSGYDTLDIFRDCLRGAPDTDFYYQRKSAMPSFFNKALWMDFTNNLCPKMFVVADLISRNKSIEICLPFADVDLVSFLSRVPAVLRLPPSTRDYKYIFREAVVSLIGRKAAFNQFKAGSNIPVDEWLIDTSFEKYTKMMLSPVKLKRSGILNVGYVSRLIKEHYSNKNLFRFARMDGTTARFLKSGADHAHKLLKLLGFQVWWEDNFR